MSYYIRPMRRQDISQVNAIDRMAFSSVWSSFNYEHELSNPLARYVVACSQEAVLIENSSPSFSRLASKMKHWLNNQPILKEEPKPVNRQLIIGFAGFWVMAGEAHITNIAVHDDYRRQGVGEKILITILELANELNAEFMTLEVRTSNFTAQNLYRKYGFTEVGLRPGYYHDNREDAILMSTENFSLSTFSSRLQHLKRAHYSRWGTLFDEPVK